MQALKSIIIKLLEDALRKLRADTCEITEEEALAIINNMTHIAVSKEKACRHLNMSRSKFDAQVLEGVLPKGRKRVGFKELVWYLDELDDCAKGDKGA